MQNYSGLLMFHGWLALETATRRVMPVSVFTVNKELNSPKRSIVDKTRDEGSRHRRALGVYEWDNAQ
jgi:hypothetical protein